MLRFQIVFILSIFALSCSTSKNAGKNVTPQSGSSFNNTEISARVLAIIDTRDKYATDSPCHHTPCEADVRIEHINKAGMDYYGQFEKGDTIRIHFMFTTGPTTEALFPNMDVRYPGIKIGDLLEADLHYNADKTPQYEIVEYQIRKK